MTAKSRETGPVFNPEGVRRLLAEGGGEDLNDDERALLLALVEADTEIGRSLSEKERAALEKLKAQVEDYDANELVRAVRHMVTSQPRKGWDLEWPELKRGPGKRRLSEE
ncbi:MAG: hypothetical protein DRI80_05905 [Chloroflexota bacterium]|nr:MAG: hypothetical protein DRI80_05905 [Chloroflexota bacterium]